MFEHSLVALPNFPFFFLFLFVWGRTAKNPRSPPGISKSSRNTNRIANIAVGLDIRGRAKLRVPETEIDVGVALEPGLAICV